ncbi:MAG TPA: hypothetical protein VHN14_10060, partial [Kofleriaceae bacterium]|nr:hypothetical protein [Kofleriaceae bacterium]
MGVADAEPAKHTPDLLHDEQDVGAIDQLQEAAEAMEVVSRRTYTFIALPNVAEVFETVCQRHVALGDKPVGRLVGGRCFKLGNHVVDEQCQASDRSLLGRLQGPGPGVRAGSSDGCGRVSLYNHG